MLMPLAIEQFESPSVSTERQQKALHALLAIQHHLKRRWRVLHADRVPLIISGSVHHSPKGTGEITSRIVGPHLPRQQSSEGPAAYE
jgi:hypothetical protein